MMIPISVTKKRSTFVPTAYRSTDAGRAIVTLPRKQLVFAQGDVSNSVFHIQEGKVRLTVVATSGKEATIGILSDGDFFGEGCLAGQSHRMYSVTAMTECTVMRIGQKSMTDMICRERAFCDTFVAYLLTRNIRYEADLVDHLFNSSEKRLARALLLLAQFGKDGKPEVVIPRISQETLAEMVGTTRGRVSFFMNRFRKLGLVRYNGEIKVRNSLLDILLRD